MAKTSKTTTGNRKPVTAEVPNAVRAAAEAWLTRMRSTFGELYDMTYAMAQEMKDNPESELARCLTLDGAGMFKIASDIASVDSTLNATFIVPADPMPNPLEAMRE